MARIRTLKPEFAQSETLGRVSRDARLLFVLLITFADDAGRARAAPQILAGHLFPFDQDVRDQIEGWLVELEREGCIRRYSVDGTAFLDLPNWSKHQKIDRPSQSRLPSFDEASRNTREGSREVVEPSMLDLVPSISDQGPGTRDRGPSESAPSRSSVADSRDGDLVLFESRAQASNQESRRSPTDPASAEGSLLADAAFDRFWQQYPKRADKGAARKAYDRVIKSSKATPDELLAGAMRYAAEQDGCDPRYTKNPATWLNAEAWLNEAARPFNAQRSLMDGVKQALEKAQLEGKI